MTAFFELSMIKFWNYMILFITNPKQSYENIIYLLTPAKWKQRKCLYLLPNSEILNEKQGQILPEE